MMKSYIMQDTPQGIGTMTVTEFRRNSGIEHFTESAFVLSIARMSVGMTAIDSYKSQTLKISKFNSIAARVVLGHAKYLPYML